MRATISFTCSLLLLAACDGGTSPPDRMDASGPRDGGAEDGGPDAGTSDGGSSPDGGTSGAPMIQDVLDCRRTGVAGGLANGNSVFRVNVDLEQYPDALCNDGTGAIFYVRRASSPEHTNRWVVNLQGGGTCQSGQSCADRWCAHETNFGSWKMSTDERPLRGVAAGGIHARDPANPISGWNHVYIYYCSSDSWSGTRRDVELSATHPTRGGDELRYRVHFLGARIFDAVVDTLRGEAGGPVVYRDESGVEQTLPDLDDAEMVILAGSSAGSGGARTHLDSFAELLRENNTACGAGGACPLRVVGVFDAALSPDRERLDYADTPFCAAGVCTWEEHMQVTWTETVMGLRAARGDTSCVEWHAANDPGTEWMCADLGHTMRHHITTPFFVRQDQADSLVMPNTVETMYRVPRRGGALLDERLFAELVAEEMAELSDPAVRATVHEASAMTVVPGTFSPRCGDHETLTDNGPMTRIRVEAEDGMDYNTLELIRIWLMNGSPIRAIATTADTQTCP